MKKRIACFPKTVDANPYQHLMMNGLRKVGFNVFYGNQNKIFGPLLTILFHQCDYLCFDWLNRFYYRKNKYFTLINGLFFCFQCYLIRILINKKVVWTIHNLSPHDSKHYFVHEFILLLFSKYSSDKIRVFSEETKIWLIKNKVPESKIYYIPEGSYVEYYENFVDQSEARKYLGLDDSLFVLLQLGSIRPYKGILEGIESFSNSELKENWIYYIVGYPMDEKYTQKVRDEARNRSNIIVDVRYIKDSEMQYYFNASDIVICPFQRIENSGSVILAMGFNKPVIAPNTKALKNRLQRQDFLLYKEGELSKTFNYLNQLKKSELKTVGINNSSDLKKYDWEDFGLCFS